MVVVHETNKGFGRKVGGAYIRWGAPYGGRHGLQRQIEYDHKEEAQEETYNQVVVLELR